MDLGGTLKCVSRQKKKRRDIDIAETSWRKNEELD